jgi:hypothetical protein
MFNVVDDLCFDIREINDVDNVFSNNIASEIIHDNVVFVQQN